MQRALLLIAAILTEVGGSLALKAALDAPWLYAITVVGYVASFILLALVLKTGLPLGVTYGIWGATDVALTAIFSAMLFGEPFTPVMALGVLFVGVGVLLVEFGSREGRDDGSDSDATVDVATAQTSSSGEQAARPAVRPAAEGSAA